jgi:hypothetical protein
VRRRVPIAIVVLLTLACPASGAQGLPGGCQTIAVTRRTAPFPHVRSLQAAVARARPCDWIVIAPGIYRGPVTIRTPSLHLRGLDRNRVIVDGMHRLGNGITVTADNVWVENLTVRNFDRRSVNDDGTGNEVRWLGVHGWYGRYLTVYDTGLHGGYGIWSASSRDGLLDQVSASGFSDAGLYVGACRDCRAVVEHALAERNLIGLAATNAGGHFLVERSLFRGNAVGVSLNSSQSDPPPPQLGTCSAGRNRVARPAITTTRLRRCTAFRDNRVLDNNALDVPSDTSSVRPGAGIGIDLLGTYADLVSDNLIAGNRNFGVLGVQLPETGVARFALAGNRISGNTIRGSRFAVALAGGDQSVDNCVQANSGGPNRPGNLKPFSCAHRTTPRLPGGSNRSIVAFVRSLHAQLATHSRGRQPAPLPQPAMPRPLQPRARHPALPPLRAGAARHLRRGGDPLLKRPANARLVV